MSLVAAVGQSVDPDGREAGAQAVRWAMEHLGRTSVVMGFVVAGQNYPIQQVLAGIGSLLGDQPILGFSSPGQLTDGGRAAHRSVVVGLLSGEDIQTQADWWPGFGDDSRACAQKMVQSLQVASLEGGSLLVIADGLNGDAAYLCNSLPPGSYRVAGGLTCGELQKGRSYQIGGHQAGNGGLAACTLRGRLVLGVGSDHGWQPVGSFSLLTNVQGSLVKAMDGEQPGAVYARLFGFSAQEWGAPPLNQLVRLYPMGLEQDGDLLVRSPVCMEADGSLRMNTAMPEGKPAYLLVGSVERCLDAARQAARQALESLPGGRPALALVLVDVAWQALLETLQGLELKAVQEVLGADVPVMGGYTYGQVARLQSGEHPQLLNQHIEVILFGDPG